MRIILGDGRDIKFIQIQLVEHNWQEQKPIEIMIKEQQAKAWSKLIRAAKSHPIYNITKKMVEKMGHHK